MVGINSIPSPNEPILAAWASQIHIRSEATVKTPLPTLCKDFLKTDKCEDAKCASDVAETGWTSHLQSFVCGTKLLKAAWTG